MIKIYHNPRCSKSRQTLSLLNENGLEPEIVEYLKNVPSENEIKELLNLLNISAGHLLRKGEQDYKDHVKGKDLSEDQIIKLMTVYPKLIERPIVVNNKKAAIGRPPENVLNIL